MAWEVLNSDAISQADLNKTRAILMNVYSVDVTLMDGTVVELYYDKDSKIDDLINQTAWAIGMEHTESFEMYRLLESRHELMERDANVRFAVTSRTGRFLMKKELFRRDENKLYEDPRYRGLAFAQAKQQYLKGYYPVSDCVAAALSAVLISADSRQKLLDDPSELPYAIFDYLPKKVFLLLSR